MAEGDFITSKVAEYVFPIHSRISADSELRQEQLLTEAQEEVNYQR